MGGKSSKIAVQSFDEAFGKLSLDEQERLELCFKRHSIGDYISFETFTREVLCEEAPSVFSKILFDAIGGTSKGISYKKLVVALVILAKGDIEEKCRFLFNMFSSDGEYVTYSEIFQCLKALENADALTPVCKAVSDAKDDRIDFEKFFKWAVANHKSFSIIGWFLDNPIKLNCDNYCPTFYQTLCGVTHLDENDIECIEKQYSRLVDYRVGKLTLNQFRTCLNECLPDELSDGLFQAFDENDDGEIDFKEIVCGISACCRGPKVERLKFIFKMFDDRKSGYLPKDRVSEMISTIVANQEIYLSSAIVEVTKSDISVIIDDLFTKFCSKTDPNLLSLNDFCMWSIHSGLFDSLLFLLYQICHIIFGLPPKSKSDEKAITLSWRSRAVHQGLKLGQIWYLAAKYWWQMWSDWMNYENNVCLQSIPACCQSSYPSAEIVRTPSRTSGLVSSDEASLSHETNIRTANRDSVQSFLLNNGSSIEGEIRHTVNSACSSESGWESECSTYSKKTGIYKKRASAAAYDVALASNTNSRGGLLLASSTPNATPKMTSTPVNLSPFRSWSPCPKVTSQSEIIIEYKPPCKPGPIDNSSLVSTESILSKLVSLTLEGGTLKSGISTEDGVDFYMLPDALWKAMVRWYRGGSPVLPRTTLFNSSAGQYELELYPVVITFLKHQQINASNYSMSKYNYGSHMSHFSGGALFGPGVYSNYSPQVRLPTVVRVPMYSAAFSRNNKLTEIFKFLCQQLNLNAEATRLWSLSQDEDVNSAKATLLDEDASTLSELQIFTGTKILIEVRNADLTWPEEIISLSKNRQFCNRESCERGLTGLNNLGNTCFLNSALQCISNTQPLTQYFTRNVHLYELNKENKFGMKGQIALQYANLIRDLWSGNTKVTAPLKLRYTVCKYAPTFNDFNQHDCQELISFLLDGLHEDLNRVQVKSYIELKDSSGRPDEVVAAEAWENHIRRNQSVIVDLFHGLLKSTVTCRVCSTRSVTFDPFTFLSLPLPLDNLVFIQVVVVKLDGSVPVKYGLRIVNDATVADLRKSLSALCKLETHNFLLLHLLNYSIIQEVLKDDLRIKSCGNVVVYAFETPVVDQNGERLVDQRTPACQSENTEPVKEKPKLCMQRSFSSVANGTDINAQARTLNTHKRSMSYVQWEKNGLTSSKNVASSPNDKNECKFKGFTIGIQRRLERRELYFVGHHQYKPITFGLPLVLPADVNETTWSGKYLYENVRTQLTRLIASGNKCSRFNHALDGDERLYHEYPFVLKIVAKNLNSRGFCRCAHCPWFRFCFGCPIECSESFFVNLSDCFVAIDWDITAWHLRYNPSLETHFDEHPSVKEAHTLHVEPITLDSCLKVFTQPEELKDSDNYYCSKCKAHCPASKKLDIWRLPPILIVHFKRFQYVNEKWVKSCKMVNFPRKDFNPSKYLAINDCDKRSVSSCTTSAAFTQNGFRKNNDRMVDADERCPALEEKVNEAAVDVPSTFEKFLPCGQHNHRLLDDAMNIDELNYDLYAVACHAGMLGAGHYVAYARNINEKWYLYNDSSCKQIDPNDIDSSLAYILFYERRGLDYGKYIPDLTGKTPHNVDAADREIESEFKRACCIQ